MGKGKHTHGASGGASESTRQVVELLASMRDEHKRAARFASLAYRAADGASPHQLAAELAQAGAEMETASRYIEAARRLAAAAGSSGCSNLRSTYVHRVKDLIDSAASFSTRSHKVVAQLHKYDADNGRRFADELGPARKLAAKNARMTRRALRSMRKMLPREDDSPAAPGKAAGKD